MSHTLSASGVFMGGRLNGSGDLIPAEAMYEACKIFAPHVHHLGGLRWDFDEAHRCAIDPAFVRLVEQYLASVLSNDSAEKGWKLPETTLVLPWIVRLFPEVRYIYWMRDPRDSILGEHLTDDLKRFGISFDATEDEAERRAVSWRYQYEIMRQTPAPKHTTWVRFEQFVTRQAETLDRLGEFLGFPLTAIETRRDSIGRWRSGFDERLSAYFPADCLFDAEAATV